MTDNEMDEAVRSHMSEHGMVTGWVVVASVIPHGEPDTTAVIAAPSPESPIHHTAGMLALAHKMSLE